MLTRANVFNLTFPVTSVLVAEASATRRKECRQQRIKQGNFPACGSCLPPEGRIFEGNKPSCDSDVNVIISIINDIADVEIKFAELKELHKVCIICQFNPLYVFFSSLLQYDLFLLLYFSYLQTGCL